MAGLARMSRNPRAEAGGARPWLRRHNYSAGDLPRVDDVVARQLALARKEMTAEDDSDRTRGVNFMPRISLFLLLQWG